MRDEFVRHLSSRSGRKLEGVQNDPRKLDREFRWTEMQRRGTRMSLSCRSRARWPTASPPPTSIDETLQPGPQAPQAAQGPAAARRRRVRAPQLERAEQTFDEAAIDAGKRALDEAGVRPDQVGLLINTSVTRRTSSRRVAVRLHHGLGLPSSAINFDIANACLGFVNGMTLAAQLIDAGQIDYAIIIDGEDVDDVQVNTIDRLLTEGLHRARRLHERVREPHPGLGAAAAVIGRADLHPEGHRILGGVTRAATEYNDLCVGSVDGMFTDAKALLKRGMELVVSGLERGQARLELVAHGPLHHAPGQRRAHRRVRQGRRHRPQARAPHLPDPRQRRPGVDPDHARRESRRPSRKGDRVLLMGVGSGINTAMMELAW